MKEDIKFFIHGDRLKKLRKDNSFTLEKLSEKTNIPISTLKNIESEKSKIPESRLIKLTAIFDVDLNYLIKRHNKILTFMLHKGGSGKTTTAVNIGYSLASFGYRILLIDADMQMNLSRTYGYINTIENKNLYYALKNEISLKEVIIKTDYENIDLVVGNYALATIESEMVGWMYKENRVKNILSEVKKEGNYDFIIIDTNPSLGLFNVSILFASEEILIPVMPTDYGLAGLEIFATYYRDFKMAKGTANILGILLNNVDKRKGITDVAYEKLESLFGNLIFENSILTDANVDNAQWVHKPVGVFEPRSRSVAQYKAVAKEILKRIGEE